ncbi:uncharacterized protein LOC143615267 [Bidens hawaiensis]|uniref:uncharacterized protein LOC143615267 n=1 Tax=Bidens hawaiensis TaxID=980011 RepID=UPI00404B7264
MSKIWESLKTRYLGADRVQKARLHTLRREFDSMKMKEGESIDKFTGKLSGMVSKFSSLGETLEEGVLVRKLFDSAPDKYLQLIASIEQCSDVNSMLFEEAIGRLKAYEDRLNQRKKNTSSDNSLLFTRNENQRSQKGTRRWFSSGGRGRCSYQDRGGRSGPQGRGSYRGRGGHWSGGPNRESSQKPRDKKHITCFNCSEQGHFASECKKEKKVEANLLERKEDEPGLWLVVHHKQSNSMVMLNEEEVFPDTFEGSSTTFVIHGTLTMGPVIICLEVKNSLLN